MILRKGIVIRSTSPDVPVFINSGVEEGNRNVVLDSVRYERDAFKPIKDWTPIGCSDFEQVYGKSSSISAHNTILVGKLAEHQINLIRKLKLQDAKSYVEVLRRFESNPALVKMVQKELESVVFGYAQSDEIYFHRVAVSPAGVETLTFKKDSDGFRFIGLHLDRSMETELETVEESMNRISFNVTEFPREVVFVNLTLRQIKEILVTEHNINAKEINIKNIGEFYFKYLKTYPCLKIVLKPYEYYIAPTDNFFHDGSTLNRAEWDICLIYLGFFGTSTKTEVHNA